MRLSKPSPSMVIASIALFVSLGGTSVAAVSYARNAGKVDGYDAVKASSSTKKAAGRLVAANKSGPDKGKIPAKHLAGVGVTQTFGKSFEVADNAPGAPQTVSTLSGLGTLTATCNDQNTAAGKEDPISTIAFNNASGEIVNVARRVGNGDGALSVAPNQTATSIAIGGSNTFTFHIERRSQNAIITGGVRQDGRGTPAATCVVFGVVEQILP